MVVILLVLATVTGPAATAPKATLAPAVKSPPLIVIALPAGASAGLRLLTHGNPQSCATSPGEAPSVAIGVPSPLAMS